MSDEQPLIRHKSPQPVRFPRHRNLGPRLASVSVRGFPDGDKGGVVFSSNGAAVWPVTNIRAFGAMGTGDETSAVQAAEASAAPWIDLAGLTVTTTLGINDITKLYFNGRLLVYKGETTDLVPLYTNFPAYRGDLKPDSTWPPTVDWQDKHIQTNGTSITQQGSGQNETSVMEIAARAVGATCSNLGWAGSYHPFDINGDHFRKGGARALSMTEADRVRLLAIHGPTSIYANDYPGVSPTTTDQLTADVRILEAFLENPPDVWFLDHNHNGRTSPVGARNTSPITITAVTLGATTTFTLSDASSLAVGDGFAVELEGIGALNNAAGMVLSKTGNQITLDLDSSGYSGAFTAGTCYRYDRATQWGAYEWLIHYGRWAAYQAGVTDLGIVLMSAPSSYTGWDTTLEGEEADNADRFDPYIESNAHIVRDVAAAYGVSYYDARAELAIDEDHHLTVMSDGTHPKELPAREAMAWNRAAWMKGGTAPVYLPTKFLERGQTADLTTQREAEYSDFAEGFVTKDYHVGDYSTLASDNFTSGLGAYTLTNTPTIVAAPWNAAESALRCDHDGSSGEVAARSFALLGAGRIGFRFYLTTLSGLVPAGTTKTVTIARIRGSDTVYAVQLIVKEALTTLRLLNYSDNVSSEIVQDTMTLAAATSYDITVSYVKRDGEPGAVIFTVNGVRLSFPMATVDGSLDAPTSLDLGITFSNTTLPITVYYGNLLVETAQVHDYGTRFTGSALTLGGKTLTIVNGKVTAEANGLDTIAKKMDMANATGLPVVLKSGSVAAHTGTTAETVLASATIPGGKMGANGKLRISIIGQHTNDAHNKYWRVRLGGAGGTAFLDVLGQNDDCVHAAVEIQAKNSQALQVGYIASAASSFGIATGSPATASQDMTADKDLVITGELANDSADSMTLQSYTIEFIPGA